MFDVPHRPTRDADLLGFGSAELPELEAAFREMCAMELDDGMAFQPESVRGQEIRNNASYQGVRITLVGLLDRARCPVQVDVGFGDAVTPGPEAVHYPVILRDMPTPRLHAYPLYTVIAEKLEALVLLGIANSRMKDYFDLWTLSRKSDIDGELLCRAIGATFGRRQTVIPGHTPVGLTDAFAQDQPKQRQWAAFLRKNALGTLPLPAVVAGLREFLSPPLDALEQGTEFPLTWRAGGPWSVD